MTKSSFPYRAHHVKRSVQFPLQLDSNDIRQEAQLGRHSNLGLILHRFGDIAGFCAPDPPYSTLILWCSFPFHQIALESARSSRSLKLFGHVIIFEVFQPERYRQTDGWTDDILWHNRALRSIVQ